MGACVRRACVAAVQHAAPAVDRARPCRAAPRPRCGGAAATGCGVCSTFGADMSGTAAHLPVPAWKRVVAARRAPGAAAPSARRRCCTRCSARPPGSALEDAFASQFRELRSAFKAPDDAAFAQVRVLRPARARVAGCRTRSTRGRAAQRAGPATHRRNRCTAALGCSQARFPRGRVLQPAGGRPREAEGAGARARVLPAVLPAVLLAALQRALAWQA
jgi:hypothetical protein